jgi:hypothetical protein
LNFNAVRGPMGCGCEETVAPPSSECRRRGKRYSRKALKERKALGKRSGGLPTPLQRICPAHRHLFL